MFLIGFIGGVLLMMLLVMLCDDGEDRVAEEELSLVHREVQTEQSRRQTRNFLYYDGTEMPIKKEEQYE